MAKINAKKEPFIKISKNLEISSIKKIGLNLLAVVFAFIVSGIFLLALGNDPIMFLSEIIRGTTSNHIYIRLLLSEFVPLLITSLGLVLAFRLKFWNIGAEGQFIIGGSLSMVFALLIGDSLPAPLGLIVVLIAGFLGGGLFALIPTIFKVKFGTNETLLTLMFNYVGIYLLKYFVRLDFFKKPENGIPVFKEISDKLWLTEIKLGDVVIDTSLIFAILILIFVFVYFNYTKHGYEINVVGDSPNTAKYSGMKVNWVNLRTIFLSGAIIGLAGAFRLTGSSAGHSLSINFTSGVGWTAIIVAWLAKLNPIAIAVVAFLMTMLERGSDVARTSMNLSSAVAEITQGIILFMVLGFDFFANYKITFRKRAKHLAEKVIEETIVEETIVEEKTEKEVK